MLGSQDSTKLGEFYQDVVGLEASEVYESDEGNMYAFNDVNLFISPHSDVHGKNSQAARHILNIIVDDIDNEVEGLKSRGAKVVKDTYDMEGYGRIATFEDIDGNFFQFVEPFSTAN